MSIQRIAKNPNADQKSITITRLRSGKLRLIYRGFRSINYALDENGEVKYIGKNPRQRKNTSITAGDVVQINFGKGLEPMEYQLPSRCVEYCGVRRFQFYRPSHRQILHITLLPATGREGAYVADHADFDITGDMPLDEDSYAVEVIDIPFVVNEPLHFETDLRVGIDLFPAIGGWGRRGNNTALRRWTNELESAGLNFSHETLLGGSWIAGYNDFVVGKVNGMFNLETLDDDIAPRVEGDTWNGMARGVHRAYDIFDQITLKHPYRFDRSPLATLTNVHGEIVPNKLFKGSDGQIPCEQGKMDTPNKFERIVKGMCGQEELRDLFKRHVQLMQKLIPAGAWICTDNECDSRSVVKIIASWLDKTRNPIFINADFLWLKERNGDGWGVQQYMSDHIVNDTGLWNSINGIRLHSAHVHNYNGQPIIMRQLEFISVLLRHNPHLMVWVSTDGAKPRLNNQEKRELYEIIKSVKDQFRIKALSYKTLSIGDTSETIKFLGGLI